MFRDEATGISIDESWAVEHHEAGRQGHGVLACWRGSQGVPFLTPTLRLAQATARTGDVINAAPSGHETSVVRVSTIHSRDHERTIVLNPATSRLYCVLKPVDPGT